VPLVEVDHDLPAVTRDDATERRQLGDPDPREQDMMCAHRGLERVEPGHLDLHLNRGMNGPQLVTGGLGVGPPLEQGHDLTHRD